MENASKALLIAGAILIAILLIAIGMMVFNSASGVIDTAASGMSDHEKTMHNKKFTVYEGVQSGTTVKEILQMVIDNNSNSANPAITGITLTNPNGNLGVQSKKTGAEISNYIKEFTLNSNAAQYVKDARYYEVSFADVACSSGETEDGIISRIIIKGK